VGFSSICWISPIRSLVFPQQGARWCGGVGLLTVPPLTLPLLSSGWQILCMPKMIYCTQFMRGFPASIQDEFTRFWHLGESMDDFKQTRSNHTHNQ
jgi:hypothetical protein